MNDLGPGTSFAIDVPGASTELVTVEECMAMRSEIRRDVGTVPRSVEVWTGWPVYWGAIWVGALAALAVALIFGLVAIAVGAHELGPSGRIVTWHQFGIGALIFSVLGAFFSFVVGGWVATRIAGVFRA